MKLRDVLESLRQLSFELQQLEQEVATADGTAGRGANGSVANGTGANGNKNNHGGKEGGRKEKLSPICEDTSPLKELNVLCVNEVKRLSG